MRILAAHIVDFRNITNAHVHPAPRVTVLMGSNGQGKTNFLEAMYAVAALRPLRNANRRDLVRAGAQRCEVRVEVESQRTGLVHALTFALERGVRTLTKEGKRAEAAEFLGHLVAVAFTPDDLEISKGSPEVRRRFIDRALLNAQPAYLERALRYSQVMKARNKLLGRPTIDEALIDSYDDALAGVGAEIVNARSRFVQALAPRIEQHFKDIAAPAPSLVVRYASTLGSDLEDVGAVRGRFVGLLAA